MAQIRADEITSILRQEIENYERAIDVSEVGSVISMGDGIARINGLEKVMAGELIQFPHDVAGIAMNLEEDQVGAVLLGDYTHIREGDEVRRTSRIMSVPVGEAMVGRVVNAIGEPIDGKGPIQTTQFNAVERLAPGVVDRPVKGDADRHQGGGRHDSDRPRPARLIIGDRQTGKTDALDTIVIKGRRHDLHRRHRPNSHGSPGGQDAGNHGAMEYTIVVAARHRTGSHAVSAPSRERHGRVFPRYQAAPFAFTTTSPSTPPPTARSRCCCATPEREAFPATCSFAQPVAERAAKPQQRWAPGR
jgi:F-type H+-transporting ATPase subunit alpha